MYTLIIAWTTRPICYWADILNYQAYLSQPDSQHLYSTCNRVRKNGKQGFYSTKKIITIVRFLFWVVWDTLLSGALPWSHGGLSHILFSILPNKTLTTCAPLHNIKCKHQSQLDIGVMLYTLHSLFIVCSSSWQIYSTLPYKDQCNVFLFHSLINIFSSCMNMTSECLAAVLR